MISEDNPHKDFRGLCRGGWVHKMSRNEASTQSSKAVRNKVKETNLAEAYKVGDCYLNNKEAFNAQGSSL